MGPITIDPGSPGTFLLLVILGGVVLMGFYYFMREIQADALALHEKRKEQQRERDRREGKLR